MLAEQNHQASMLLESISAHVREQQRAQESQLRMLSKFAPRRLWTSWKKEIPPCRQGWKK
eukprot:12921906-Prorocentrum_lima.AAC.1